MPALDLFAAFVDAFPLASSAVRAYLRQRYKDRRLRNKLSVLTAEGRALEQQVLPLVQQMYEVASRGLSEDGWRASLVVPAQITQNLTLTKS